MNRRESGITNLGVAAIEKGQLLIDWIGQAGYVFKTSEGTVVCIDPYLSNSIEKFEGPDTRRLWFPSFALETFRPDIVICTHDHLDHTDPETLPMIAAYSDAIFMGPEESCKHIAAMNVSSDRIRKVEIGQTYEYKDVRIKPTFALHTPGSIGVVLEMEGIKIYFTADTQYDERLLAVCDDSPDLLLTCINAKYGNLNAQEACELAMRLKPDLSIPMHYGLIPSNTVPPDEFVARCKKNGIACTVLKTEVNYILSKQKMEDGSLCLQIHN